VSDLAQRYREIVDRIDLAAKASNRSSADVTLVVVTKNHPHQLVLDLLALGARDFGENRDQEAAPKAKEIASLTTEAFRWHFVGQLQSNKVRSMLSYSSVLHSLDRSSLLKELGKQLAKTPEQSLDVFIELNLTDDPNRGGVELKDLMGFTEQVLAAPQLKLLGVMGVAGLTVEPAVDFARILKASQEVQALSKAATFISAGMSGDFEEAIGFGATHLRIGTAITGKR